MKIADIHKPLDLEENGLDVSLVHSSEKPNGSDAHQRESQIDWYIGKFSEIASKLLALKIDVDLMNLILTKRNGLKSRSRLEAIEYVGTQLEFYSIIRKLFPYSKLDIHSYSPRHLLISEQDKWLDWLAVSNEDDKIGVGFSDGYHIDIDTILKSNQVKAWFIDQGIKF